MIRVHEINDIDQLDSYELAWSAMVAATPQASYFHTLAWLRRYWQYFGKDQHLCVIMVHAGSELIGILPLTVIWEKTRVGRIKVLTYPLHDWASFYSPVGPQPAATLMAAIRYLRQRDRDWDILDLRWTNDDSVDRGRTNRALRMVGFQPQRAIWKELPMVDLSGTWDDYLASRSPKFRGNVRRCRRNLEKRAHVEYVRYRPLGTSRGDDDPRWDLYDACIDIARRSWQGDSANGTTMSTDFVRAFLRDSHADAVRLGSADVNLLWVDKKPVAYCYNFYFDGRIYGLRSGFDPEYAKQGVGTVLMSLQIEDSFGRGDKLLDLGAGYLSVKARWVTHYERSWRHTCYASRNVRAQALRLKRWTEQMWNERKRARRAA